MFSASYLAVETGKTVYRPLKADVIIVPGAMAGSVSLYCRCDRALELYRQGYAKKIITTGAKGPDEPRTEASDAAEYLAGKGVPKEDILLEEHSRSTEENLKNAQNIMEKQGFKTAIIATSDFHVYRCMQLARKIGIHATGAPSGVYEPSAELFTLRETGIIMVYAVTFRM